MKYTLIALILTVFSTNAALADLKISSFNVDDVILVEGNLGEISDRRLKYLVANNESVLDSLKLITPRDFDVYLDESLAERRISITISDSWIDVFAEILRVAGLKAKIDLRSRTITITD